MADESNLRVIAVDQPAASLAVHPYGGVQVLTAAKPLPRGVPLGWHLLRSTTRTRPREWVGMAGFLTEFTIDRDARGEPWYLLDRHWRMRPGHHAGEYQYPIPMPFGELTGAVRVAAVVPIIGREEQETTEHFVRHVESSDWPEGGTLALRTGEWTYVDVSRQAEHSDFTPGRWAYVLTEARPIDRVIACAAASGGRPGDEVLAAATAALGGWPADG